MGWSGAYRIFDVVAAHVLNKKEIDRKKLLRDLIDELESGDWDTQKDSDFWHDPLVQEIMKEKHPRWFDQTIK